MSVSLEALAMAGIDSNEWAMDAKEWERDEMVNDVPPHLLVEEDNDNDDETAITTLSKIQQFQSHRFSLECLK
ncbi:hypothetical protein SDJN02_23017, partial [Cucurbita argyrosperma subsp. argyrosperma]